MGGFKVLVENSGCHPALLLLTAEQETPGTLSEALFPSDQERGIFMGR
ncbi:MAG: hypothetical protein HY466_07915 [Deltaproteobacteria bacterium]|nr:hypothetical protein [Deltaproteobacteria bacterium]